MSRAPTNGVTVVEHAFPLPISSVSLDGPKSYPAGSVVDAWLAPSTRTVSVEPVRTKPTTCHRPSLTLLDVERFTVGAGRGAFDEKMNNRPSLPMATFHCGKLPQFPPAMVPRWAITSAAADDGVWEVFMSNWSTKSLVPNAPSAVLVVPRPFEPVKLKADNSGLGTNDGEPDHVSAGQLP